MSFATQNAPKVRIISLADKNCMRSRNENYKTLRISFYFRPGWQPLRLVDSSLTRFRRFTRSIRRNRKSFHVTKEVHRLQRFHSRSQSSSFVATGERARRNISNSENSTSCYNKYFIADHTPKKS